jgi:hypothetical protein
MIIRQIIDRLMELESQQEIFFVVKLGKDVGNDKAGTLMQWVFAREDLDLVSYMMYYRTKRPENEGAHLSVYAGVRRNYYQFYRSRSLEKALEFLIFCGFVEGTSKPRETSEESYDVSNYHFYHKIFHVTPVSPFKSHQYFMPDIAKPNQEPDEIKKLEDLALGQVRKNLNIRLINPDTRTLHELKAQRKEIREKTEPLGGLPETLREHLKLPSAEEAEKKMKDKIKPYKSKYTEDGIDRSTFKEIKD